MAFDFQQFRSELTGDGARPNLFEVILPIPTFSSMIGQNNEMNKFTFMCRATQIPGDAIGFVQVPYFGRTIKVAGNRTFPEWTVTIINDEDFTVRNNMEHWMNGLNTHDTNVRIPAAYSNPQYTTDALVKQYGKRGPDFSTIKQYRMIGCFPIDISSIDLNWATNDVLEEFSVTFALQWWNTVEDGVTF